MWKKITNVVIDMYIVSSNSHLYTYTNPHKHTHASVNNPCLIDSLTNTVGVGGVSSFNITGFPAETKRISGDLTLLSHISNVTHCLTALEQGSQLFTILQQYCQVDLCYPACTYHFPCFPTVPVCAYIRFMYLPEAKAL